MSENCEGDVVMWVRLPKPVKVEELKKMGIPESACYGGNNCIAATSMDKNAGIIVTGDLEGALAKVGIVPQARCFGGNSCIV